MRTSADDDFDDFVRGQAGTLLRTAYLLTGDHHTAEDLVQEVLEQVYARWRRISGAPEAYVRRAMVNRARNRWRWRRRRPEWELSAMDEAALPDRADEVVYRQVVVEALRALPVRQRAAVVLRYLDDLPVAEVAEALGCSESAVKSHTSRGLAKLRRVLDVTDPPSRVAAYRSVA